METDSKEKGREYRGLNNIVLVYIAFVDSRRVHYMLPRYVCRYVGTYAMVDLNLRHSECNPWIRVPSFPGKKVKSFSFESVCSLFWILRFHRQGWG